MLKRVLIEIHGSLPWIACPFVAAMHRIIAPLMSSRDKLALTNCMPFFFYHTTHDYFSFGALNEDAPAVKKQQQQPLEAEKQKLHF
jgi:hypothetical protein